MIEFHKIWIAQCDAARDIKEAFGQDKVADSFRSTTLGAARLGWSGGQGTSWPVRSLSFGVNGMVPGASARVPQES